MANEACPLPTPAPQDRMAVIKRMLAAKRIAVVGASDSVIRPSHQIATYLIEVGKEMIPVNPPYKTVLDRRCYASLAEVPGQIDVVNVFRRSQDCAQVVREAIAAGAKGVWLQAGITSDEGRKMAEEAGIDYVENRCIMVDHMRMGR